jgi:hypothetical protein
MQARDIFQSLLKTQLGEPSPSWNLAWQGHHYRTQRQILEKWEEWGPALTQIKWHFFRNGSLTFLFHWPEPSHRTLKQLYWTLGLFNSF